MVNVSKKVPQLNYSQLSRILAGLGFVRKETDQFTVFGEQTHDAIIVLPKMKADTEIGDPYRITIRNTVAGKGIVSREEIEALLNRSVRPSFGKAKSRTFRQRSPAPKPRRQLVSAEKARPSL